MTWIYKQSNGELLREQNSLLVPVGRGYSGHGNGLNNPELQDIPQVGPIPRGNWTIGFPHWSARVGPFAMTLFPSPETKLFGRSDFLIHGDNHHRDQSASRGCVILNRVLREAIHASGDTALEVI